MEGRGGVTLQENLVSLVWVPIRLPFNCIVVSVWTIGPPIGGIDPLVGYRSTHWRHRPARWVSPAKKIVAKIMPKIKMPRFWLPNSWHLAPRSFLKILPSCHKILATILPPCPTILPYCPKILPLCPTILPFCLNILATILPPCPKTLPPCPMTLPPRS